MPLVDEIAAIAASRLADDEKRARIYAVKVTALLDAVLDGMLEQTIEHEGFTFRIDSAQATPQNSLALVVTFARPPADPVTHQIIITNPPLLPRNRTGIELEDMRTAIREMLEGFV